MEKTEDQSGHLVELVLDRYQKEVWNQAVASGAGRRARDTGLVSELAGFVQALSHRVDRFDLLALDGRQNDARLITASKYPPLRCTQFSLGNLGLPLHNWLYRFPQRVSRHARPLDPFLIADHVGQDTPRK